MSTDSVDDRYGLPSLLSCRARPIPEEDALRHDRGILAKVWMDRLFELAYSQVLVEHVHARATPSILDRRR